MHIQDDLLSAHLDGEVDSSERTDVESHLAECGDCRSRADALAMARDAVAGLPKVEMTGNEIRELRRAMGTKRVAGPSRLWPRFAAAAGALGVVVVAFIGYSAVRNDSPPICSQPVSVGPEAPRKFDSDAEVAAAVSSDTNITSKLGDCTVSDVGKSQQEALNAVAGGEATEQTRQDAPQQASDPVQTEVEGARPLDFCLRERLRLIPKPTMPISGRAVIYRGEEAWLLVYAYADTAQVNDQLDLMQIWVVRQVGCEKDEAVLTVQSQHKPRP